MTIVGSNVSAIKTELVSRWSGRAGLSGVQVLYQTPVAEIETSAIWFGRASSVDASISMKGSGILEIREDVDIEVMVQALEAETQTAADTTAVNMLGEILEELATYPDLGGNVAGLKFVQCTGWEQEIGVLGNSSLYGSRFELTVTATSLIKETSQ